MSSIFNKDIREFLSLKPHPHWLHIIQVDSLGVNEKTLMFINKLGVNLHALDESNECVYLMSYDYPEYHSTRNDFIRVSNPKFEFSRIVSKFNLRSRLQIDYAKHHYLHTKNFRYQREIYCAECIIGDNCQIDPGAIIGGTDFSPVMGSTREELIQFPQLGGVYLGDNVLVKYNTMIGKGTFDYTRIGDNTMIDFGCQIGHNCIIGKSCIIAAGTIIGGSTTVGDCTTIGIGAKIRNGIKIGKNVSIGMGSVVIKDVPDNSVVVGNPATIIKRKAIFDEGGLV